MTTTSNCQKGDQEPEIIQISKFSQQVDGAYKKFTEETDALPVYEKKGITFVSYKTGDDGYSHQFIGKKANAVIGYCGGPIEDLSDCYSCSNVKEDCIPVKAANVDVICASKSSNCKKGESPGSVQISNFAEKLDGNYAKTSKQNDNGNFIYEIKSGPNQGVTTSRRDTQRGAHIQEFFDKDKKNVIGRFFGDCFEKSGKCLRWELPDENGDFKDVNPMPSVMPRCMPIDYFTQIQNPVKCFDPQKILSAKQATADTLCKDGVLNLSKNIDAKINEWAKECYDDLRCDAFESVLHWKQELANACMKNKNGKFEDDIVMDGKTYYDDEMNIDCKNGPHIARIMYTDKVSPPEPLPLIPGGTVLPPSPLPAFIKAETSKPTLGPIADHKSNGLSSTDLGIIIGTIGGLLVVIFALYFLVYGCQHCRDEDDDEESVSIDEDAYEDKELLATVRKSIKKQAKPSQRL